MYLRIASFALSASVAGYAHADVTGVIKLDGKPPELAVIDMSGVRECAAAHVGQPVHQEIVVVGKNGGLANVVVSLKKVDGQEMPPLAAPVEPAVMKQKGCLYSPHVISLTIGEQLAVKNEDAHLHNVHMQMEKSEPDGSPMPMRKDPFKSPVLKEAEYFRIKCDVHPWMSAWVAVIDNPYHTVTDSEGKFMLPAGLKDGEYTFHLWHEKYGEQDVKAVVKKGNAEVNASFKAN